MKIHCVLLLTAALAGAGAAAPEAMSAEQFALRVAASDKFEILSSKTISTIATAQTTKNFGIEMVNDHTKSTEKLAEIVKTLKPPVELRAEPNTAQKKALEDIRLSTGTGVDNTYLDAQIAAHEQTLALLKSYAATGKEPKLKAFAAGLVPTVAAHLDMAKKLRATPAAD